MLGEQGAELQIFHMIDHFPPFKTQGYHLRLGNALNAYTASMLIMPIISQTEHFSTAALSNSFIQSLLAVFTSELHVGGRRLYLFLAAHNAPFDIIQVLDSLR